MKKINPRSRITQDGLEMMVTSATEADKKQISILRKTTEKILWKSIDNQRGNNSLKEIADSIGVSISALIQLCDNNLTLNSLIRNIDNFGLATRHSTDHLKSRLNIALKRIQSMNVKELFAVIRINKDNGPKSAIDYILSPFEVPLHPVESETLKDIPRAVEISSP